MSGEPGVERIERPLTKAEKRWLRLHLALLDCGRVNWRRRLGATLVVIGPLWILTLFASRDHPVIATAFWLVFAIGMNAFHGSSDWMSNRRRRAAVHATLNHDRAIEMRVRCRDLLRIEEMDDWGDCWLLDVEDNATLVLWGQDYYEDERFPSSDFSLVDIKQDADLTFRHRIVSRAPKLNVRRTFPESAIRLLKEMAPPDSFFTVRRSLGELESLLSEVPADGRYR